MRGGIVERDDVPPVQRIIGIEAVQVEDLAIPGQPATLVEITTPGAKFAPAEASRQAVPAWNGNTTCRYPVLTRSR